MKGVHAVYQHAGRARASSYGLSLEMWSMHMHRHRAPGGHARRRACTPYNDVRQANAGSLHSFHKTLTLPVRSFAFCQRSMLFRAQGGRSRVFRLTGTTAIAYASTRMANAVFRCCCSSDAALVR